VSREGGISPRGTKGEEGRAHERRARVEEETNRLRNLSHNLLREGGGGGGGGFAGRGWGRKMLGGGGGWGFFEVLGGGVVGGLGGWRGIGFLYHPPWFNHLRPEPGHRRKKLANYQEVRPTEETGGARVVTREKGPKGDQKKTLIFQKVNCRAASKM